MRYTKWSIHRNLQLGVSLLEHHSETGQLKVLYSNNVDAYSAVNGCKLCRYIGLEGNACLECPVRTVSRLPPHTSDFGPEWALQSCIQEDLQLETPCSSWPFTSAGSSSSDCEALVESSVLQAQTLAAIFRNPVQSRTDPLLGQTGATAARLDTVGFWSLVVVSCLSA